MPAVDTGLHQSPSTTKVKFKISLPEHLYVKYEEQASKAQRSVETEVERRLERCSEHTAGRGIYLNDDQRAQLEKASGRLITTPEQAVQRLTELSALMVDDIVIDIPLNVQKRIASRAASFRKDYPEYLKKEVGLALQRIAGLLP